MVLRLLESDPGGLKTEKGLLTTFGCGLCSSVMASCKSFPSDNICRALNLFEGGVTSLRLLLLCRARTVPVASAVSLQLFVSGLRVSSCSICIDVKGAHGDMGVSGSTALGGRLVMEPPPTRGANWGSLIFQIRTCFIPTVN